MYPLRLTPGSAVFGLILAVLLSCPVRSAPGLLLVANKGDHSVSLVDPETEEQMTTLPENGVTGHELIASPDGKLAFVPIYGNSGVGSPGTDGQLIRVMDLGKRQTIATIDFGRGVRPHCPVFNPKTGVLYVTTEIENTVSIIDPSTFAIIGSIPTGKPQSHMLVVSHDGRRGYTTNVGSGTVSVLDLEAKQLITIIPVTTVVQRISITPDDQRVFTADQTKLRLVVINTATNSVGPSIPLPGLAYGTAGTADGRWLVAALPGVRQVALIDLSILRVVKTLDVPKSPQEVLIRPDGLKAYVSCDKSGQIAVIDLTTWKVEKLIKVGPVADGLAWANR
jgi:DNA-binding beta-propeller fold protein YncE